MSTARELMASAGVIPKKSKGQNFLIDDRVADRIVGYAGITPSDRVLEIGPGFGVLTDRLAGMGSSLTCIELDTKLASYIRSTYGDRLTLIEGDAVKVPFPEFDVLVSNLPYSVSTPIIFKLLEHPMKDVNDVNLTKVNIIQILKIMEKTNEDAEAQLAEIEEWERYKHQKHDLFVSRNETADHFIEQSSKILALEN